jgi:hypothetical protein
MYTVVLHIFICTLWEGVRGQDSKRVRPEFDICAKGKERVERKGII